MNKNTRTGIVVLIAAVIFIILLVVLFAQGTAAPAVPVSPQKPINTVSYACDAGKTIVAAYYEGTSTPAVSAGQPPVPGGSVSLALSDGRKMILPQTISADGTRYASADNSIVFWSKGNGLTFTENSQQTFSGCISVASDTGGLTQAFESGSQGFSLRYPAGFTPVSTYSYQALGPGKNIAGVKFTIDPALATGTNLSNDSYLSVEQIPQSQACSASSFLQQGVASQTVTDGSTDYSVASSTDAAVGNRYFETVYALPGTNPCVAVRYFIHYGVIENYPAGTVKSFDQAALVGLFDTIRRTLTIAQ